MKLAVIVNPRYGINDRGFVGLSFEVYIDENICAGAWLPQDEAATLLKQADVSDVSELHCKVCWVVEDGPYITYVKYAKIL